MKTKKSGSFFGAATDRHRKIKTNIGVGKNLFPPLNNNNNKTCFCLKTTLDGGKENVTVRTEGALEPAKGNEEIGPADWCWKRNK